MSGFSQGARSQLAYVVEVTFNSTPGSPTMLELPFNTNSLDLNKETLESAEIRSDRQIAIQRHGNKTVSGAIEVDFRADDFDDLLESAFFNTFDSSSVLKAGITPQHLTIEEGALDITQFRVFTGCTVNSMSMSIQPNAIVTATFDIVGGNMTQSATPLDASITVASGNDPFDSFSGTLQEGGGGITIVSGLDFTLDNSVAPAFVVGNAVAPCLEFGRSNLTGTLSVYYEDAALIDKFIAETESSIQVALASTVTGDTYTILIPRVKYNGASVPVADEQSRIIALPFQALRDVAEATNIKITKS